MGGLCLTSTTENTLFQHHLINFVFSLASVLSNMHHCPCFLVREEGEERWRRRRVKTQLHRVNSLKRKTPWLSLLGRQQRGYWGTGHPLTQCSEDCPAAAPLCPRDTKTFLLTPSTFCKMSLLAPTQIDNTITLSAPQLTSILILERAKNKDWRAAHKVALIKLGG